MLTIKLEMTPGRLRCIAFMSAAAVVLGGCTAVGGNTDKVGGSEPVVLRENWLAARHRDEFA